MQEVRLSKYRILCELEGVEGGSCFVVLSRSC